MKDENNMNAPQLSEDELGMVTGGTNTRRITPLKPIEIAPIEIALAVCPHCLQAIKGTQAEIDAHIASCTVEPFEPEAIGVCPYCHMEIRGTQEKIDAHIASCTQKPF